ncbi:GRIP1-associated protein 1 isoform X1, partial [Tachysurus ichikawai]
VSGAPAVSVLPVLHISGTVLEIRSRQKGFKGRTCRIAEVIKRLEELVLSEISSPCRTQQTGDSSSVSSFSYREMMKEGASAPTTNKSNTSSPQSQRPADLSDDEVNELFQRLAEVQQEKWLLEEKVKHLEVSCSSMADDICKKSAIIETYVMDSRRGKKLGGSQFVFFGPRLICFVLSRNIAVFAVSVSR